MQGAGACYTTGRYAGGRVRHGARVARRLVRDAARLGLGALDAEAVLAELVELGRQAFGDAEGIVRLEARAEASHGLRLVGSSRPLGEDATVWRAWLADRPHEGPTPLAGVKRADHPLLAWARDASRARGFDEALLLDAGGRLVEGARSTPVVCAADGRLVTPPLRRGGVAGVAREILALRVAELEEGDLDSAALAGAREIVAVNAVRGARTLAVPELGAAVEAPGPWAGRLAAVLDAEE